MDEKQPDEWRVQGDTDIDHDLMCECEMPADRWRLRVDEKVRAWTEDEAIESALNKKRWWLNLDKDCAFYFIGQPKLLNLSQYEREIKALADWQAGQPIPGGL